MRQRLVASSVARRNADEGEHIWFWGWRYPGPLMVTPGIARWLILSLLGLFGMLMLAGASPAAGGLHVPTPTGTFHVSTRSMALVDRARREPVGPKRARSLVIQLWYPAAKGGPRAPYMSLAVARVVAKDSGVQPALLACSET